MRARKRILFILVVGTSVVGLEVLGFHLLNRELTQFAKGFETMFQSMGNVAGAATVLSPGSKKAVPQAQIIPDNIWGKWVVTREIPTTTISCWSDTEARALLGTEIEYSPELFRWKDVVTSHPVAETKVISAEQFHDDNSGQGSKSSQITFSQLGIKAKEAIQISIRHPPAEITGATIEIPGDKVLVKSKDTIIFAVCNVYFEARRVPPKPSA